MSDLRYLIRTTCLLESRSEQYGAYLARVLPPSDGDWVRQWASEEACHGALLRDWLAEHDPDFDFAMRFARLETLAYHADESVDRTPAEELLSRCVVEALAAGFYRAIRDAATDPSLRQLATRLMADEARHFAGFRRRLAQLPPLSMAAKIRVVLSRVRELDDDQIMFASHCANHGGAYDHALAHRRYMSRIYPLYEREHLAFIQSMLFKALGVKPGHRLQRLTSRALLGVLRVRTPGRDWRMDMSAAEPVAPVL